MSLVLIRALFSLLDHTSQGRIMAKEEPTGPHTDAKVVSLSDVRAARPLELHPMKLDEEAMRVVRVMREIEAVFAAHGMVTHLTDARAGLDLKAVLSPSGTREAEIWLDEDGYIEVRYWSPPGASAAQISASALRALRAITGAEIEELDK
jgi:hypothetical protein